MALFLLAKSERIKMDNTNVFDFEKRWVKDLGLPEEVAHRIANIADLFEMISDQRLNSLHLKKSPIVPYVL